MSFFQLFQYCLGSGKRTTGDFSSEQLLHAHGGVGSLLKRSVEALMGSGMVWVSQVSLTLRIYILIPRNIIYMV